MFSQQNSPKTLVLQTVQYKPLYTYIHYNSKGWRMGKGRRGLYSYLYTVQCTVHRSHDSTNAWGGGRGEGWGVIRGGEKMKKLEYMSVSWPAHCPHPPPSLPLFAPNTAQLCSGFQRAKTCPPSPSLPHIFWISLLNFCCVIALEYNTTVHFRWLKLC